PQEAPSHPDAEDGPVASPEGLARAVDVVRTDDAPGKVELRIEHLDQLLAGKLTDAVRIDRPLRMILRKRRGPRAVGGHRAGEDNSLGNLRPQKHVRKCGRLADVAVEYVPAAPGRESLGRIGGEVEHVIVRPARLKLAGHRTDLPGHKLDASRHV